MNESTVLKQTSSVYDVKASTPPFGSRFLTDESEVWTQNAWDHVPPPDDQAEIIAASLARQRKVPVPDEDKLKYNEKPAKHWDNFYKNNADHFFRDRKWLQNEFPELIAAAQPEAGPVTIAEIGCGAGNSVFPLLSTNRNPHLSLLAYDYSSHAVKLVQNNPLYTSAPAGTIHASVWDLTSRDTLPTQVEPESVDIIVLVFVLSALHPDEWQTAVNNIFKILKPGGLVLMRDYGRHDLTQLRFKGGRLLDDHFYIRGDKTRVYFFELDELSLLFTGSRTDPVGSREAVEDEPEAESAVHTSNGTRLTSASTPSTSTPTVTSPSEIHPRALDSRPLFVTDQLGIDRRLIVNRKRQLKMYRVWMQGKFRKPVAGIS